MLCSLTLSELNGLFDELGIASDLDAQKVVHRILYMMGEGLDRDKLNAMLRDGTIALKLQANFHIFGAPVDLGRWTRVGFDFREPITEDVAVNKSIFNGCTMHLVLASWSGSLATRWHRVSTACRCPWLTGLRRTGSYTQRRLYPTRHPPHRSACLLHRSLLHSTPLHSICLLLSCFLRTFASFSCA